MGKPEEERRRRLRWLAQRIKEDGESDLVALEGLGALRWGCRRERVREYVDVLEAAGLVFVSQKGEVKWTGD